ncbi:ATP-binding protein [uncultured Aquimarina sp.]|uniref:tetratricopeptide repeat-containing sensor histidine kinase n=1 Tax=uncultured Aquimarina sp. TaxID=575652 RepID=UPI002607F518|nr:ATP-binding protein [uncultured Aquimarina sp.]
MKHIIVSFLFFITIASYSQKDIDSDYLKILSKKSSSLRKQNKMDSAIIYAEDLLKGALLIKDTFYILKSYDKLAQYHRLNNSSFISTQFYIRSKELNLIRRDTSRAVDKLRFISSIQKKLGDFNSSENTTIQALNLSKSLPDSIGDKHRLGLYNILGITTKELKNYQDSKEWYLKALEISIDPMKIAVIKGNIANVDIKLGNYKKAIDSLSKLIKVSIPSKELNQKAKFIGNLAYAKSKLNYPEAEKELKKALKLRVDIKDLSGQFASNIHLTEYYQERNEDKKALFHANKAYQIAIILKNSTSKTEALSYLIDLKENPKKEAIEFERLTDSIYTARDKAKNQFAKIKFRTDELREQNLILDKKRITEENKNLRLEALRQKEASQKLLFASATILVIISSIYLFFYLRTRHRKEKILERHTTEKRLSKKLHDEVGNDVFYLMSQLQNENNSIKSSNDINIIDGLDAVYHKVRDFSRDHTIETGAEYGDELLSLLNSYGNQEIKIFTKKLDDDFWITISEHKKVALYWALKELLTNMKKHSKATVVSVSIVKEKKNIVVKYTDNGIGMNMNDPQKRKNGLHNVENRIKEMKGTITFDTKPQEGFKASIEFAP